MGVKIGIMADNQGSDGADDPSWSLLGSPEEYRRFSTASARLQEAVSTFNSESVDLVIDLGDLIDFGLSQGAIRSYLQARVAEYGDLTMPWIGVQGNHDSGLYVTGEEITGYYTDIDVVHAARENVYEDASGWKSYTYDLDGLCFICIKNEMTTVEEGLLDWFEARLAGTSLPVIIICHVPIWQITEWAWTYANDYADFQAKINAADNVQAVLCGHYHWDNGDVVIQNVPYYSFFGSVLCPNADDNAYFIVEVIPNAVGTPNGPKANIQITGFGSNGTAKTTDFKKYLVA